MQEMLTVKGIHAGMQSIGSDEDLTFCRQMGLEYVDASPLWRWIMRGLGFGFDASHPCTGLGSGYALGASRTRFFPGLYQGSYPGYRVRELSNRFNYRLI